MITKKYRLIVWMVLIVLVAASQPATASKLQEADAPTVAGDEYWDDQFLLGVSYSLMPNSSSIYAIAVNGTDIYAGGDFDHAGDVAANNIAKWDSITHHWSALGSGVDGWVHAIAVDGDNVYVGGHFWHTGGMAVTSLARWNSTTQTWYTVGGDLDIPSFSPDVNALAVAANGDVYVGGSFVTAGGVTVNNIARWDGSNWHALGAGTGGTWSDVYAIAISGSDVYIGGRFSTAGGNPMPGVAHWNGNTWSGLGSGVGSVYAEVDAIVIDGTYIYIGGRFDQVTDGGGAHPVGHVAMWNGAMWNTMGGGVGDPDVAALAVGPDHSIYVGGRFQTLANGTASAKRLARWDGSNWHSLGGGGAITGNDGVDNNVNALAFMGHELFIGGFMKGSNDLRTFNYIGYWDIDDTEWYALGNSVNGPVYALAVSGDEVYLGGSFTSAGGVKAFSIARWNQRTGEWSDMSGGVSGCTGNFMFECKPVVYAIKVVDTDVFVGGNFTSAGGVAANSIARWDTTTDTWNALGDGVTCSGLGCSAFVHAISSSIYYGLVIGGKFDYAGGPSHQANNIAVWNYSGWDVLGNGTNGIVYTVENPEQWYVWIGGRFTSPASHIAHWDVSWLGLPGGSPGNTVIAINIINYYLYAGGSFTNLGGPSGNYVAVYNMNQNSWQSLGEGLNGSVNALYTKYSDLGNDLYAGGEFTASGTTGMNRVAKFSAGQWSGFGSGADNTVYAVGYDSPYLYVGGNFLNAGDKPSSYFGRWGMVYEVYLPLATK